MCGSLPFRCGVVSLRPLSVCHGSSWLVTALFPSLSLYLPVPIFWFHLLLSQGPWVCYLAYLWLYAHLLLGLGFHMLPSCPSPSIRLWDYWFQWLLFSTRVPYLRDGVTPAGSRIVSPRSERRFSVPVWVRSTGQFMVGPYTSVCGVSARPVPQGVLPGGPRCVLSSLQCSSLSHVRSQCCLHDPCYGSGVVFGTLPYFLPAGVCASVGGSALRPAASGALFPGGLYCSCGSWEVLGSLHWAPLAVGLLPGPPALLCLLSAGCLLGLETSPSGEASASALGLPEHLLWSSLRQRVGESSYLSAWSFPFGGLSPFSRLFLSWRPCRSRSLFPSLAPSWWWPCPLLRWALLTLSDYVLSMPSAVSLPRYR